MHSIVLKFDMHITDFRRTHPIDFGECRMHSFFYRSTKKILIYYRLRSKILKNNLVFKWYIWLNSNLICILKIIVRYIVSILVNLRLKFFFFFYKSRKSNSYALRNMESNYKKYASIQMVLSIELKFHMCIIDHRSSYYFNFGVSRMNSFFTGHTKYHTLRPIGSKYLFHFSIVKLLESV